MADKIKDKEQEETEKVLEAMEPVSKYVDRVLGPEGDKKTYTQKPLSLIKKTQLGALVSRLFQKAAAEGGPGSVSEILSLGSTLLKDDSDFEDATREAESFVLLLASLGSWMPDFISEFYIIVLNVPKREREFFLKYVEENEDDGGFSDEVSLDIFTVFYKQNKERFVELFTLGTGFLRNPER